MQSTREQLDDALNKLEDAIPRLVRDGRHETDLAREIHGAMTMLEAKLSDSDRRHFEQRARLIFWDAGILPQESGG